MSEPANEPLAITDGVRYYTIMCLAALFVGAVALAARGLGAWSFFPCVVGCIAVAGRFRAGFFLYMMALLWMIVADRLGISAWDLADYLVTAFLQLFQGRPRLGLPRGRAIPLMQIERPILDVLLCVAVVAFAAAFFRLVALTRNVFPIDRRRRMSARRPEAANSLIRRAPIEEKRSPGLVERIEGLPVLLAAAAVVIVAELLWVWLADRDSLSDLSFAIQQYDESSDALVTRGIPVRIANGLWRLILALWLFFIVVVPIASIFSYLGMRRATAAEAELFLQDCLWRETRREQSRNNRWLAWAEQRKVARPGNA